MENRCQQYFKKLGIVFKYLYYFFWVTPRHEPEMYRVINYLQQSVWQAGSLFCLLTDQCKKIDWVINSSYLVKISASTLGEKTLSDTGITAHPHPQPGWETRGGQNRAGWLRLAASAQPHRTDQTGDRKATKHVLQAPGRGPSSACWHSVLLPGRQLPRSWSQEPPDRDSSALQAYRLPENLATLLN